MTRPVTPTAISLPATSASRARKSIVFASVLILGFAMFAAPAIYFQMGNSGGYAGRNFTIIGIVQLVFVLGVVVAGLRLLGLRLSNIGLRFDHVGRDAAIGAAAGAVWTIVQFGLLFPVTGGEARPDIAGILEMVDGRWVNVLWYLPLGWLGGAVAEEIYNRGFFITILADILGGTRTAAIVAGTFSVLFFAAGHLPSGLVDWIDILIPSTMYAVLFLATGRLTAPIVAHAIWNAAAVSGIFIAYG